MTKEQLTDALEGGLFDLTEKELRAALAAARNLVPDSRGRRAWKRGCANVTPRSDHTTTPIGQAPAFERPAG